MTKKRSTLAEARSWATKRGLFGAQAFLRYVILRFTENLNRTSDEFVFKGGNLLWVYINTPRATTDLDLATLHATSHSKVRALLERACRLDNEIQFKMVAFKEVDQDGKVGAAVTFSYSTGEGATNQFDADIVYAIETDAQSIISPLGLEKSIQAATIENIITDKLAACHRFGAGNTRMKDYDDLWRLSQSSVQVRTSTLRRLLRARKVEAALDPKWIEESMERSWRSHSGRYKDLPSNLAALFEDVNRWLDGLL